MNDFYDFLGVTFSEFLAWYRQGRLRTSMARLQKIGVKADARPDPSSPRVVELFEKMPDISVDEDADVLLVQLNPAWITQPDVRGELRDPLAVTIDIAAIGRVIPLTERARRILRPRMLELGVRLEDACFESPYQSFCQRQRAKEHEERGDRLLRMLVDGREDCVRQELRDAAKAAHQSDSPGSVELLDRARLNATAHLLAGAFSYTRHRPGKRCDEYLVDLGLTLRSSSPLGDRRDGQESEGLQPLQSVVKSLKASDDARDVAELLSSTGVVEALEAVGRALEDRGVAVSPLSLLLFLKWKQSFQDSQRLELEQLAYEITDLGRVVQRRDLIEALWLLGFLLPGGFIEKAAYGDARVGYGFYEGPRPNLRRLATAPTSVHLRSTEPVAAAPASEAPESEIRAANEEQRPVVPVAERTSSGDGPGAVCEVTSSPTVETRTIADGSPGATETQPVDTAVEVLTSRQTAEAPTTDVGIDAVDLPTIVSEAVNSPDEAKRTRKRRAKAAPKATQESAPHSSDMDRQNDLPLGNDIAKPTAKVGNRKPRKGRG